MYRRHLISLVRGSICAPWSCRKYPVGLDCCSRHYSTSTCNVGQLLTQRGVVQVRGPDSNDFLQGLVTNDIHCPHGPSLFAMMLNIKGRVLYDMIIHSVGRTAEPCYLLDVDRCVTTELISTIKRFKIRKKVDISDVTDEMKVWAILPPEVPSRPAQFDVKIADQSGVLCCSHDPRLHALGHRAVLTEGVSAATAFDNVCESTMQDLHRQYRYTVGIGEGVVDHPPGNCLPLECNLVFLNGVSFDKGCYIGQELTARSHHTGVVRKRLMPVHFTSDCEDKVEDGTDVCNRSGKKVGTLRGVHHDLGLALVRLSEVKDSLKLEDNSGDVVEAKAAKPFWWPVEVR